MQFKVKGQMLKISDEERVAEGAVNFTTFSISCDREWTEFVKTVRFRHEDDKEAYDIPDVKENTPYYLPSEVLRQGKVYVGVIGVFAAERVATTTKAFFEVEGAIEKGKTPRVTPDAYAAYVKEVTEMKKSAESYGKLAEKSASDCEEYFSRTKDFSEKSERSVLLCEKIFREISGMTDAVGKAMSEIYAVRDALSNTDSALNQAEEKRILSEKARCLSEKRREEKEAIRENNEFARGLTDSARLSSDKVRETLDGHRELRFKEIERYLEDTLSRCSKGLTLSGEKEGLGQLSFEGDGFVSLSVFGRTDKKDGRLLGVGEEGAVSLTINENVCKIYPESPLHSLGEICDEIVISDDGASVIRRIGKIMVDPNARFEEEENLEERILIATAFQGERADFNPICKSNLFEYGEGECENSFWLSGDYLFFSLKKEDYPDVQAFIEKLASLKKEGGAVEILYPLFSHDKEECDCDSLPSLQGTSLTIASDPLNSLKIRFQTDLLSALAKINERLEKAEKGLGEKEKENEIKG